MRGTIRTVAAARYVTPLREGGSLPAVVEADDGELYVMKFSGAGQGVKALVAEVIAGELARFLGLRVPEIVYVELDADLGRSEPDPEIQDLLRASVGLNMGMRYLPSAFAYNSLLHPALNATLASDVVWFDAFVTNVDRTARNVNLLIWQNDLWLIDHGASLYFHHDWNNYLVRSQSPFSLIRQHTLLELADDVRGANERFRLRLTDDVLRSVVALVPDVWLDEPEHFADVAEHRRAYVAYLQSRLEASEIFVKEATDARAQLV